MGATHHERVYLFDEFVLEPRRGTLKCPGGADLELRPKVHDLLVHMLENPGRLLGRQALLEALWPNVAVTDDSLTQSVSDLRHALGKRATHILRTFPRRGYMLIADVRRGDAEPVQTPKQTVVSGNGSTAVLVEPFGADDLLSSRLARMFHTDLVTELTSFEDVRLVSPSSEEAGCAFRVCGEVWPADLGLRVSIRLMSPGGGASLWASKTSLKQGDELELYEAQLSGLSLDLVKEVNRESLRQARETPNADRTARQLFLLGRDLHHRATEADTLAAIPLMERAIRMDPGFAVAIAHLAFLLQRSFTSGWGHLDPASARDRSLELARRAVRLEPASPACLAPLAFALLLHGRWDEAIATARAAVTANRRNASNIQVIAAIVLSLAGLQNEAIEVLRRAIKQDAACPPTFHAILGRALLLAGQLDEALNELRLCAAHIPDYAPCQQSLVVAATETGRPEEARAALREVLRLDPSWTMEQPDERWLLRHAEDQQRFLAAFRRTAAREAGRAWVLLRGGAPMA